LADANKYPAMYIISISSVLNCGGPTVKIGMMKPGRAAKTFGRAQTYMAFQIEADAMVIIVFANLEDPTGILPPIPMRVIEKLCASYFHLLAMYFFKHPVWTGDQRVQVVLHKVFHFVDTHACDDDGDDDDIAAASVDGDCDQSEDALDDSVRMNQACLHHSIETHVNSLIGSTHKDAAFWAAFQLRLTSLQTLVLSSTGLVLLKEIIVPIERARQLLYRSLDLQHPHIVQHLSKCHSLLHTSIIFLLFLLLL
jgi:hypothetical protein